MVLKPQKPCSRVGAEYIYINQLFSKRFSNKSKNIIKMMLKLIPKQSKHRFKIHWKDDAKNIEKHHPKYTKLLQKENPGRVNESVVRDIFPHTCTFYPRKTYKCQKPIFSNKKRKTFSTPVPFPQVRPTSTP